MQKTAHEDLQALSQEDLEAVAGGRWVYLSETSTTSCTSNGSRCGTQTVVERVWVS